MYPLMRSPDIESAVRSGRTGRKIEDLHEEEEKIWIQKGFETLAIYDMSLDNFLEDHGFSYFWDLYRTSELYLLKLNNLGPKKIIMLRRHLGQFGLRLPEELTQRDYGRIEHGNNRLIDLEGIWSDKLIAAIQENSAPGVRIGELKTAQLILLKKKMYPNAFAILLQKLNELYLVPSTLKEAFN